MAHSNPLGGTHCPALSRGGNAGYTRGNDRPGGGPTNCPDADTYPADSAMSSANFRASAVLKPESAPGRCRSMSLLAKLPGAKPAAPLERCRDDGARRMALLRLGKHRADDQAVGGRIAGSTKRKAEGVRDNARQGWARHRGDRRDLRDRDRCDPRVVKPSLEQSDRLLADRSSRNQQHQVDAVAAEPVDGDRDMPVEDHLAVEDRSHHRNGQPGHRPDHTLLRQPLKRTHRPDNLGSSAARWVS